MAKFGKCACSKGLCREMPEHSIALRGAGQPSKRAGRELLLLIE